MPQFGSPYPSFLPIWNHFKNASATYVVLDFRPYFSSGFHHLLTGTFYLALFQIALPALWAIAGFWGVFLILRRKNSDGNGLPPGSRHKPLRPRSPVPSARLSRFSFF